MKRIAITAIVLAAATTAAAALAAMSGSQISGGLVGTGVLTYRAQAVELSAQNGFVMEWAKVPPGESFGWHFHRRPVAVAVTAGTLTLYDGSEAACAPHRYSAGQGFVEPANHVHIARNEGTKTVSLYAIYLGTPAAYRKNPTPLDVYVKAPGNCPADVK
jgi:quercetin dioxygenase-like cupin family protein